MLRILFSCAAFAAVAASLHVRAGDVVQIDAGSRLQVLWDDHVVDAEKTTASQIVHEPQYAGVAMKHDKPWEGDGSDYHCIVPDHDDRGDFLRMYYLGWAFACGWKDVKTRFSADGVRVCYAESRDNGLTWQKPNLGLVEFRGSKDNNCLLDNRSLGGGSWDNFMVFKDENPACPPDERYKGIGVHGGLWCFLSADGIHFRKGWLLTHAGAFDSLNVAFWDKTRGEYHLYFRGFHKVKAERNGDLDVRDVRHCVSKDFKKWTEPKKVDGAEVPRLRRRRGGLRALHERDRAVLPRTVDLRGLPLALRGAQGVDAELRPPAFAGEAPVAHGQGS